VYTSRTLALTTTDSLTHHMIHIMTHPPTQWPPISHTHTRTRTHTHTHTLYVYALTLMRRHSHVHFTHSLIVNNLGVTAFLTGRAGDCVFKFGERFAEELLKLQRFVDYVCIYVVCMYVCACMHVCACMYVCMYVCACM